MPTHYWMVKQEPEAYSWMRFLKDGGTAWTGVRNYAARINLRAMRLGDLVCYYHSVTEKRVVGVARVVRESYPDPTAKEGEWVAVDLAPAFALDRPVSLEIIKAHPLLSQMQWVRQSRLSVSPLEPTQFQQLLSMGGTPMPVAT